ncbi:MAG: hypothetical protein HYY37_01015 [Candidatus Aenigmarchaeota archaeon]|nr:hypothetical protein [Candidatus Aenigmarchaeota archaeon]
MRLQKEHLVAIAIVAASVLYLVVIEDVYGKRITFNIGGRDLLFSPFDIVLVTTSVIASALVVVSFLAYQRTADRKLFVVSLAFIFFTIRSVLDVFDNFFLAGYSFLSIAKRLLDLLIVLAFLFVLFRK